MTHPERAPKLLTSLDVKAELVAGLGVSELVVIPFDDRFALQTPQDFIDHVLVDALQAQQVSVGQNFRFGHGASGGPDLLAADARFQTRVVTLVEAEGEIVSSTHIRALVAAGEVEQAARFLGAPFQLRGTVVHGDQRGRTLGFPTANIVPDEQLVCPGFGVYAALADGAPRRGLDRRATDLRRGPQRARRGVRDRRRHRPLRPHAAARLPRAAARRAAL